MDVFKTHGAFSWSELTTTDPDAAAGFYAELFGWTVKAPDPAMGGYRVVNIGDAGVAGIMAPPPGAPPMPPHWGSYVTVKQIDETVGKVLGLGGKVLVPVMDVPNVGRMAVIQDPQGSVLSVIQYAGG
ncbi:MAG: VOC family protein [Pseudomonadota bacterium]|jgi:predicted enzyme related to lactoylglutathione lyase